MDRLTVDVAKAVIAKHNVKLTPSLYVVPVPQKGRVEACAIGVRVLQFTDDPIAALTLIDKTLCDYEGIAKAIGDDPNYLQGLEYGFSHGVGLPGHHNDTQEYKDGFADGEALYEATK